MLNPEIYKAAVPTITTEHVIITDKQLKHIRERHPDISATVMEQLTEIIHAPDYIIETDMPYTANILKHLEINGKGYQLVLRIRTDSDPEEFQNSVITFMPIHLAEVELLTLLRFPSRRIRLLIFINPGNELFIIVQIALQQLNHFRPVTLDFRKFFFYGLQSGDIHQ